MMHRNTGGNTFIPENADRDHFMKAIEYGLDSLERWCEGEEHLNLDLGRVTIDTKRISDGRISVSVEADLGKVRE